MADARGGSLRPADAPVGPTAPGGGEPAFRFEKTEAWQRTLALTPRLYAVTAGFPDHERHGLGAQMRRAVVALSTNIAQGGGPSVSRDAGYFLGQAYAATMELVCETEIAARLGYVGADLRTALRQELYQIATVLLALRKAAGVS